MNKFSLLFKDRQLAAKAKANSQEPIAAIADPAAIAPNNPTDGTTDSPSIAITSRPAPASVKLQPKTRKSRRQSGTKKSSQPAKDRPPRKRGRPANGKRSNPGWFGRTFYIRKETDERLESALYKLRRSGIDLDKSQLVDGLLNAWAQVELGQAADLHLGEIIEHPTVEHPTAD